MSVGVAQPLPADTREAVLHAAGYQVCHVTCSFTEGLSLQVSLARLRGAVPCIRCFVHVACVPGSPSLTA